MELAGHETSPHTSRRFALVVFATGSAKARDGAPPPVCTPPLLDSSFSLVSNAYVASPVIDSLPQLLRSCFLVLLSFCALTPQKNVFVAIATPQDLHYVHVLFLGQPKTHPELAVCMRQNQTQPNLAEKNLFDCIREEDVDTLRRYVERGAPVHVADTLGDTSLLVAASTGNPEVVKVSSLVWFLVDRFGVVVDRYFLPKKSQGCCCWLMFFVVGVVLCCNARLPKLYSSDRWSEEARQETTCPACCDVLLAGLLVRFLLKPLLFPTTNE